MKTQAKIIPALEQHGMEDMGRARRGAARELSGLGWYLKFHQ